MRFASLMILMFLATMFGTSNDINLSDENNLVLEGENGGNIDGTPWFSQELLGKANVLVYADPTKKPWIQPLMDWLELQEISFENFSVTVIINTDATIIPNFVLASKIKQKAKENPHYNYVFDHDKILVEKWKLQDENVNVLFFDSKGENVFTHHGKVTEDVLEKIEIICKNFFNVEGESK